MCKKLIFLMSFVLMLSLVCDVQADNITWTDATGDHNWFTALNWDLGTVPSTSNDKSKVNMLPGPTIAAGVALPHHLAIGTAAGSFGAVTLDGGTLTLNGSLRLADESSTGEGTFTMNGGTLTYRETSHVGKNGKGTLNMNGGSFSGVTGDSLKIAEQSTGRGHVNLAGGTISVNNLEMVGNSGAVGTMDVGAGTLILNGDRVSNIQGFIDNGWIYAYGGSGWLQLDYDVTNTGKTTLSAYGYRLNMIPANGSIVPISFDQLQWTLPEPNRPGDVVTCDVYFGTNPNVTDNPKVVEDANDESVSVGPLAAGTYYWGVYLYDPNMPGYPGPTDPFYWSPRFTVTVENLPPIVNAGDDVDSWLVDELPIPEDANRVVQLNGIVTDDGQLEPFTVNWTVVSEPNSVTHPAVISDASIVNPTITMTALPGLYELELEAYDGELTSSDTIAIRLYDTSCEHARNQAGFGWLAGDINHDCKVDFLDFANFAATWLDENYSTE